VVGATRPSLDLNSRGPVARDHARLHFNHHIPTFNFQGVDRNLGSGIVGRLPSLGVPLPAVPGTDHLVSLNHALPQRTAAMQAFVVHGGDGSVHVGYADYFLTHWKFFSFTLGRKIGLSGKFYKIRHETFQGL